MTSPSHDRNPVCVCDDCARPWVNTYSTPVEDLLHFTGRYPRPLSMNHTHHFGEKLGELPQEVIEAAARSPVPWKVEGWKPSEVLEAPFVPRAIKNKVAQLPWGWGGKREHRWLYIRPQLVKMGEPDRRSGSFWHVDVDAVFRSVAPDWDDFRAMAVSFGNIAETEFIKTPFDITVDGPPKSADYVHLLPQIEGKAFTTHTPQPGQIAHYTVRDFHRAGPPRQSGWRLIILAFETNAKPQDKWP